MLYLALPQSVAVMNGLLLLLGSFMALRSLWVLFHADRGRKHDLAFRPQVRGQDFTIGMLVPVANSEDARNVVDLMQCLAVQQYPHNQIQFVVVAPSRITPPEDFDETLLFTSTWMAFPQQGKPNVQAMLRRGIEKMLASATPPHLLTICQPGDLLKPDYFSHLASVAYKHDAFQGYPAYRSEFEESLLSRSLGAQGRLASRVQSVGRFYGGFGVLFGSSGLAFKPSLAEQFPVQYHPISGFGEWAITLNHFGIPISWAPNVVVYQREERPIVQHVALCLRHLYRTLTLTMVRTMVLARPREIEQRLALIKHNPLLWAFFLLAVGFMPATLRPGSSTVWFALSTLQLIIWLLQYRVARLSVKQLLNDSTAVLGAAFMGCAVVPVSALYLLYQNISKPATTSSTQRIRKSTHKATSPAIMKQNSVMHQGISVPSQPPEISGTPAEEQHPSNQVATIPLLHKGRIIQAELNVYIEASPKPVDGLLYQLNLVYNKATFTTEWYTTLEHAYAQLCESLAIHGITPITCGSCAYLYYPEQFQNMRELEQGLPQHAMCLWGQEGQPPNIEKHTALHVLSKACEHHTSKQQHEVVIAAWKASLMHEQPSVNHST